MQRAGSRLIFNSHAESHRIKAESERTCFGQGGKHFDHSMEFHRQGLEASYVHPQRHRVSSPIRA